MGRREGPPRISKTGQRAVGDLCWSPGLSEQETLFLQSHCSGSFYGKGMSIHQPLPPPPPPSCALKSPSGRGACPSSLLSAPSTPAHSPRPEFLSRARAGLPPILGARSGVSGSVRSLHTPHLSDSSAPTARPEVRLLFPVQKRGNHVSGRLSPRLQHVCESVSDPSAEETRVGVGGPLSCWPLSMAPPPYPGGTGL